MRRALEPMLVSELKHLSALLDDPLYVTFKAAISGPTAQQEIQASAMNAGLQLGPALNSILERHQLKKIP
jgi:hypothetical protein